MKFRCLTFSLVLPSGNVHKVLVVTLCLTLFGLAFNTEVSTAGLFSVKGIVSHKFADFEEVFKTECLFELLVELILASGNLYGLVELLLELVNLDKSFLEALLVASHSYILPHNVSELFVNSINRFGSVYCK